MRRFLDRSFSRLIPLAPRNFFDRFSLSSPNVPAARVPARQGKSNTDYWRLKDGIQMQLDDFIDASQRAAQLRKCCLSASRGQKDKNEETPSGEKEATNNKFP